MFGEGGSALLDVDGRGGLMLRASLVDDYLFQPRELTSLCLWDYCAHVDVARSRRRRQTSSSHVETDADDVSDDSSCELNSADLHAILNDSSRRRRSFPLLGDHNESESIQARVWHPRQTLMPVLVGAALPRRDRVASEARYCRAMLLEGFHEMDIPGAWRSGSRLRECG